MGQGEDLRLIPEFPDLSQGKRTLSGLAGNAAFETFGNGRQLPLVIRRTDEAIDLAKWVSNNADLINRYLLRHGAILFRQFEVRSEQGFEAVAHTLCHDLFPENPEHTPVSADGLIQTPVFYPPDRKLLWHNENSFNKEWPLRLLFCCIQPADQGGETPLVDSRLVLHKLDSGIVKRFAERGIMYVRNYGSGLGLSWQVVFRTDDKSRVAEYCQANDIEFEWRGDDELRTRFVRPAVVQHPVSGEESWFNQAQHWHISCLDEETRVALLGVFGEDDLPRMCYYGDGSRIEDAVMQEILDVYRGLEVSFPWESGDVLVLDNVFTAHGRNPFSGKRRLLVAMGEMHRFEP